MEKSGQAWKVGLIQLAVIGGLIVQSVSIHLVGTPRVVHAEQSGPFASLMVDPSLARYSPTTHVSGGFKVQGSDTMHALMRRLVSDFQVRQPKVTVDLRSGGRRKQSQSLFSLRSREES